MLQVHTRHRSVGFGLDGMSIQGFRQVIEKVTLLTQQSTNDSVQCGADTGGISLDVSSTCLTL